MDTNTNQEKLDAIAQALGVELLFHGPNCFGLTACTVLGPDNLQYFNYGPKTVLFAEIYYWLLGYKVGKGITVDLVLLMD